MIDIAKGNPALRSELFRETSRKMGIHEAIIEKDFWVCVILFLLFTSERWKNKIIFKGGTSLSKVYSLINRFSEDIDLILDWRELGFSVDDPWKPDSNSQKDRFVKDVTPKVTEYLQTVFIPDFQQELVNKTGINFRVELESDAVTVQYPKAFENTAILPHIILEIGPLAGWTPHQTGIVTPYAQKSFPILFHHSQIEVQVVTAERTFWEKATILHQEYNRPETKHIPPRYSRHYYDVYKMVQSPVFEAALKDKSLLQQVIAFKERFYRAPWSGLSEIKEGSFHLAPPANRREELFSDYKKMKSMIFVEEPSFAEKITELSEKEKLI